MKCRYFLTKLRRQEAEVRSKGQHRLRPASYSLRLTLFIRAFLFLMLPEYGGHVCYAENQHGYHLTARSEQQEWLITT